MNRSVFASSLCALCAAALWTVVLGGQSERKASWLTDGDDPQRTSWQRNETILSPTSVKDMKLLWKVTLDNAPRQMHNLFGALIVPDVQTTSGPREIAVVAGVSDNVYGI